MNKKKKVRQNRIIEFRNGEFAFVGIKDMLIFSDASIILLNNYNCNLQNYYDSDYDIVNIYQIKKKLEL